MAVSISTQQIVTLCLAAQLTLVSELTAMNKPEYLFVDLDGTLIRTDLFVESLIRFLRKNPLNILKVVYLFFRRRSVAKALIARHVKIRPETLPYEIQLVDYLREEKKQGRRIILATAAHWTYANRIAAYLTV